MNYLKKNRLPSWFPYLMGGVILLSLLPVIFFVMIWHGSFGPVPGTDELSEIRNYRASQVYSADQELLGTYYIQNRTEISIDQVDPVVVDALLAIEDIRFYNHNGIDYRALARVGIRTLLLGQNSGGGSTITQQLAKNLYPRERNGPFYIVADKIREMIIARRMESVYDKDEILALYLNSVSFGEEIYGIDMASRRFFNKRPSDLELHEAATLTGMLRATSWYNPHRNPDSARQRRNVVIRQMEKYDMITAEEADRYVEKPMETRYSRITESDGPAPYFREHVRGEVLRILENEEALDGETYNLYTDGLIIQTTVDSRIQKAAEDAVATQLKNLQNRFDGERAAGSVFADRDDPAVLWAWRQSDHYRQLREDGFSDEEIEDVLYTPAITRIYTWNGYEERELSPYDLNRHYISFLNTGFLAMHPENGHILAWVGGINHRYFKYDHVKSRRQPGSAFKPIVYSAALESGMQPCDYQRNILSIYEDYEEWMPRNVRDEYGGRYSIQGALAQSINTIAVEVLMETGIRNVQHTAAGMGIQSVIPPEPSVALGTAEVSLLELTTAYTTFLNGGKPATPKTIKAIYNSEGELIYDFSGEESGQSGSLTDAIRQSFPGSRPDGNAISEETAGAMVQMLSKVVNEGTGHNLRSQFGIRHAVAGKTGTTQNFSDGWFVGMTPDMVFGSWVGGSSPRVRFSSNMGYASQTALPVAGYFLNNLRGQNGLEAQRNQFTAEQTHTSFDMSCPDFQDDRFRDRLRDFFSGRDSEDPRVVEEKEEERSRNVFRRLGGIFSRDRN
ncbi:MAG: transglycosylase domain-containing protein [Balneolaceae bacterium]|nr:transglycosylase domain-containing protein [Balneolaceae bacterium]